MKHRFFLRHSDPFAVVHCLRHFAHRAKPASILLVAEAVRNGADVLPPVGKGRESNQRPGGEQLRELRGPEFLSTHPSDYSRIQTLQAHMPEAMELYRRQATESHTAMPLSRYHHMEEHIW